MKAVKTGTWLSDLIEVYNDLGGVAAYKDVYPLAKHKREARGASWTIEAQASIRRTVEDHAKSSANFRGSNVFYSVNGHGKGVWGLMPEYIRPVLGGDLDERPAYLEGTEGIVRENLYLRKSRDPRLVEARKVKDNYTCQVCGFRLMAHDGKYIIDVHHLNPIGSMKDITITAIDELICLCPTCHRIAHIRRGAPLETDEIREMRGLL